MKNGRHESLADDPRLTAYVLGELEAHERADVEARLADDAEARRAVDDLRELGSALSEEMGAESDARLTAEQRGAILAACAGEATPVHSLEAGRTPFAYRMARFAAAAVLVGIVSGLIYLSETMWSDPNSDLAFLGGEEVAQYERSKEVRLDRLKGLAYAGRRDSAERPARVKFNDELVPSRGLDPSAQLEDGVNELLSPEALPPEINMRADLPMITERALKSEELDVSDFVLGNPPTEAPVIQLDGLDVDATALYSTFGVTPSAEAKHENRIGYVTTPGQADELRAVTRSLGALGATDPSGGRPAAKPATGDPGYGWKEIRELDAEAGLLRGGAGGKRKPAGITAGRENLLESTLSSTEGAVAVVLDSESTVDTPFDARAYNDVVGVGGGAGGAYRGAVEEKLEESLGRHLRYKVRRVDDLTRFTQPNTEAYDHIVENAFLTARQAPLSTFSIDVDTASYANVRRFLHRRQLPPIDSVRIEELVNYFSYAYPLPGNEAPFTVSVEISDCPWRPEHRLARVGLKGREVAQDAPRRRNLVFLCDVSGSMDSPDKLPLLQRSLGLLVDNLTENDRVGIVVYAGASGLALAPTDCGQKQAIRTAIDNLKAGGSTNGGAGIELAYKLASENFIPGGVNRVILATDGDFNVGVTDQGSLVRLIEEKAKTGVFLSVLGYGTGNLKDSTMEKLADKGNGNYAYIDTLNEARKVLVHEMGATLETIAKDVKIQIEFNPAAVSAYRQIGYENRVLAHRDFNDDTKDAGEIGAGHTVTALYEIVPVGVSMAGVDALKYQATARPSEAAASGEAMTVKLRFKEPEGTESSLIEIPVVDTGATLAESSEDFRFAAAVASFGMILRHSSHGGNSTLNAVYELAAQGAVNDPFGYRQEFLRLVDLAAQCMGADVVVEKR